jgi:predicted Zn-ribbon and HTH transcriptional regulator
MLKVLSNVVLDALTGNTGSESHSEEIKTKKKKKKKKKLESEIEAVNVSLGLSLYKLLFFTPLQCKKLGFLRVCFN